MAYGDTEHDEALRTAWHDFCDRLKEVGELVFADPSPATPLERAVGLQYVARNISTGLDIGIEHADPLFPHLFRMMGPYRKWGGDNPDCIYFWAFIDGRETYRLTGNRGSAHFVAFSANRPTEAVPEGESAEVGRLLGGELQTEWDGSFVVTVSPEPQPGNWIRTTPDVDRVWIRQFFGDWNREQPMNVRIERVGAEGAPPQLTPERLAEGLGTAAEELFSNIAYWRGWQEHYRAQPNRFLESPTARKLGAAPGGLPQHCYFMVQPDEALLIEFTPPDCFYWNFELNTYWMTSIDYRYHLSSINGSQAVLEDDGSVILVVAHDDPGVPNWLATDGHCEGHIGLRWMQADSQPTPATRLVKLADLPSILPRDAPRIDEAERREQLRLRRIGVDRRFRL